MCHQSHRISREERFDRMLVPYLVARKVGICQKRTDPDFGGLMAPWMTEEYQVQVQVGGCPQLQASSSVESSSRYFGLIGDHFAEMVGLGSGSC